jgi:hypothetical protein
MYNKFKYQYGGRANFLYDAYSKLTDSGLIGNMRFEDFSQLPPDKQEELITQLSTSNLNQYRYGGRTIGRFKGQLGLNALSTQQNQGNVAGMGWGQNAQLNSGLAGIGAAGAQMLGSTIASDAKADTGQAFAGNIIGGMGSGAAAGAAFGPIGMGVGAALGAVKGTVDSINAKNLYLDSIKDDQKPNQIGELKSSYNPQLSSLRYGGVAAENAYAKSRANLEPHQYSFTAKGINVDSKGIKRAGYQVGGNLEMREYPTYSGTPRQYKFINEYKHGGDFKPRYDLEDNGEANVEVESGEAIGLISQQQGGLITGDPTALTLHGGNTSSHESPVGMMVKGAEHGEKNKAGTEGIPVSFNNPDANPDGAFVYSKYLTPDGRLAKGKGDTPRDSVAGKVKPLLKYAEKMNDKMNDKYYNNPVAMQAIQEEMQYQKDRAEEGKFLHGLNKLLGKKQRNFNEIIDYISQNNPNNEAQTVEGVGGINQMQALAGNPNIPGSNPEMQAQNDPNVQMLEQVKGDTLAGVEGNEQSNPQEAMMKKGGWMQKATDSIEENNTEGVCTGSKFGGPNCPEGSKRYNLAKTFRKMAKNRQEGGYIDEYYDNDFDEIEDEYIYRNGGYADYYGYKPTGGISPEGYYVGGYEDRMAYGYGGKYLQEGGVMYDAPDNSYISLDNGFMRNPNKMEQYFTDTTPMDQYYHEDTNPKILPRLESFLSRRKNQGLGVPGNFTKYEEGRGLDYDEVDNDQFELANRSRGTIYQQGGPMIPTYQDAWRKRNYSQPINQDYYGESSHITANTTTPYKRGGMFIAQEGMQMEAPQQGAPQPQGDPMLAQARQAMLQGAAPQGPVADPMMEDQMMQQGMEVDPNAPMVDEMQPQEGNPIEMIAQALPDWFKSDNSAGGLGIFTQPAVAEMRKAGFNDREIATFTPEQATPDNPIIQFLMEEAQGMSEMQAQQQPQMEPQMQPGMEQMKRGGQMKYLQKGQYVKFQMGGQFYEGKVKYFDPRSGNFELE